MQCVLASKLNLNEHDLALWIIENPLIMSVVGPSEVKVEWLIHQVDSYLELERCKVITLHLIVIVKRYHVIVHCLQELSLTLFGYPHFNRHCFLGGCHSGLLWLLNHDLQDALLSRGELYHIVSIMVHYESVSNVEVSTLEFLVIGQLVQVVGEIRSLALLLEDAGPLILQVVRMVDIVFPSLQGASQVSTLHGVRAH
jgi:hypothetical protein